MNRDVRSVPEAAAALRAINLMLALPCSFALMATSHIINVYGEERTPGHLFPPMLAKKRRRLLATISISPFGLTSRVYGYGCDTSELVLELAGVINTFSRLGNANASLKTSVKRYAH